MKKIINCKQLNLITVILTEVYYVFLLQFVLSVSVLCCIFVFFIQQPRYLDTIHNSLLTCIRQMSK